LSNSEELTRSPVVSVVIPTYNGSRYLRETVESVLLQSFQHFELFVIDDGSDEPIEKLLQPYADRIRYVKTARCGPAAARNLGIALATGTYVALLDHDDVWHRDNLLTLVGILDDNPQCSLVYSYPRLIDGAGETIANERPSHFPAGDVLLDFLARNRITTFSATLIRRSILGVVGPLDESPVAMTADDYDLWLRIADAADVLFAPGELVSYRIHAGNLLKNHEQNLRAHLHALRRVSVNSRRLKELPSALVEENSRANLYATYRKFAFIHFYRAGGARMARGLFWKAFAIKPLVPENLLYFGICCFPEGARQYARRLKKYVSGDGDKRWVA
jgi:glycosyltransferase involved in cell wall biosynthesis